MEVINDDLGQVTMVCTKLKEIWGTNRKSILPTVNNELDMLNNLTIYL